METTPMNFHDYATKDSGDVLSMSSMKEALALDYDAECTNLYGILAKEAKVEEDHPYSAKASLTLFSASGTKNSLDHTYSTSSKTVKESSVLNKSSSMEDFADCERFPASLSFTSQMHSDHKYSKDDLPNFNKPSRPSHRFRSAAESTQCGSLHCSSSWPKENMFLVQKAHRCSDHCGNNCKYFRQRREHSMGEHVCNSKNFNLARPKSSPDKIYPLRQKGDHCYARDNVLDMEPNTSLVNCKECKNVKVSQDTYMDHSYDNNRKRSKKSTSSSVQMKRSDHSYSWENSAPVLLPGQTLGSVDSLDMELSQSDTESCSETESEEKKVELMSTISAWLLLKKDHPYSSA